MGAVTPVPFADKTFMKKIEDKIVLPTIRGLKSEDIDYRGFIFFGLINVNGEPLVIEYNVRMGDPETQAVLPRISSDLVDILWGCATGSLNDTKLEIDPRSVCTIVMVSGGYPGSYQKGMVIEGLGTSTNNLVFHAGTTYHQGRIVTDGGRVLAVTSFGKEISEALESAYHTIKTINWQDANYRKDIGQDLLEWINKTLETSAE
jgi:phosphoribosylamine--glycine ligase